MFVWAFSDHAGSSLETRRPGDVTASDAASPIVLENAYVTATFSGTTGALLSLTSLDDGVATAVNQSFGMYTDHGNAYAFQPLANDPTPVDTSNVTLTVVRGPVMSGVYQTFGATLVQAVRLWNCTGCAFVEAEVVVGPLEANVGTCAPHSTTACTCSFHCTVHAKRKGVLCRDGG